MSSSGAKGTMMRGSAEASVGSAEMLRGPHDLRLVGRLEPVSGAAPTRYEPKRSES